LFAAAANVFHSNVNVSPAVLGYLVSMPSLDTTPQAAAAQTAVHRRLGPTARFQLAIDMSALIRECVRAGISARHPEYTPAEVTAELIHDLYRVSVRRA
jgi:hypothetical protein